MNEGPLRVDHPVPSMEWENACVEGFSDSAGISATQSIDPSEDIYIPPPLDPQLSLALMTAITPRYAVYVLLSLGFEALRFLKIPVPDVLADTVLGKFRSEALSYKDKYLNMLLATHIKSFTEGMEYLVSRQNIPPEEAFKTLVRYILTRRDIDLDEYVKNPDIVEGYYVLRKEDVLVVESLYPLEVEQMDRLAGEVAAEILLADDGRKFREPILVVLHEREGAFSGWEVREMMDAAERAGQRLKRRLERTRGQVTRSVLSFMVKELERQLETFKSEESVPEKVNLPVGTVEEIAIDLSAIPADQRLKSLGRYLSEWKRILSAIDVKGELSPEDASLILSLSGEYPQIDRFKALSGTMLEEEIAAVHKGVDFLFGALNIADPISKAKKRVLLKLSEAPGGVIGYSLNGGEIRLVHWAPTMKVYERDAARVGPYTFFESSVARIHADGSIRYESAMVFVDRRGRPGILTISELESLLKLEGKLGDLLKNRPDGENIVKAYRRFLVDLKRAWKSVPWEDARAGAVDFGKDPRKFVEMGAERIRQLAPGYELVRLIRLVSQELIEARVQDGIRTESVVGVVARLTLKADPFFLGSDLKEKFRESMKRLADHIANGNEDLMFEERGKIKGIIYLRMDQLAGQDLGHLSGNTKTGTWGEEVKGWLDVVSVGVEQIALPELERLSLLRIHQGQFPSLSQARSLFAEERYAEALSEYGRIAIDGRTEVSTRLTALVELFRVAYFRNDVIWMNKAIGEMDYLLAVHRWQFKPEEVEMMQFALRLEETGIIRLGNALREALKKPGPGDGEGKGGGPLPPVGAAFPDSEAPPAVNRQASVAAEDSLEPTLRVLRNIYGSDILERMKIPPPRDVESLLQELRLRLKGKGHWAELHDFSRSHEAAMLVEALQADSREGVAQALERGYRRVDHYHSRARRLLDWEEARRERQKGLERSPEEGERRENEWSRRQTKFFGPIRSR